MKKEIQEKAEELSILISRYELIIKEIEELIKSSKEITKIEFTSRLENRLLITLITKDDLDKNEIEIISKMSLNYILEIYKMKLNRLKYEYDKL